MADFDYDKLDQAITKFMRAMGAADDDIEAAKADSIDQVKAKSERQSKPKPELANSNGRRIGGRARVLSATVAPTKTATVKRKHSIVSASDNTKTTVRQPRPVRMIGGKATNNLSPENTLTPKQKRALAAQTVRPGKGHYLDMVTPSSDAANRHKPNLAATENAAAGDASSTKEQAKVQTAMASDIKASHSARVLVGKPSVARADRHNLAQPAPVNPVADFVSAADTDKPYVSPFLPGAVGKKRPLGGATSGERQPERHATPYHSMRHQDNQEARSNSADSTKVASGKKISEALSEAKRQDTARKKNGLMKTLAKIGLFLIVVLAGALIGVICFYFFG